MDTIKFIPLLFCVQIHVQHIPAPTPTSFFLSLTHTHTHTHILFISFFLSFFLSFSLSFTHTHTNGRWYDTINIWAPCPILAVYRWRPLPRSSGRILHTRLAFQPVSSTWSRVVGARSGSGLQTIRSCARSGSLEVRTYFIIIAIFTMSLSLIYFLMFTEVRGSLPIYFISQPYF